MKYSLLSRYRSELMGLAMISVMLFHSWDLDLGLSPLNYLRSIGFGGVDIFMLLSGIGLAMSLSRREQEYGEFMERRAKRLLPAYFAVMVPYTLCLWSVGRAYASTLVWNSLLLNYWVHCAGSFNWYVSGIMLLYLVTPPAVRFLRSRRHPGAVLLAVTAVSFLVSQVLMRDTWWNHLDLIYRVPIYTAGLVIGIWIADGKKFGVMDGVALALLFSEGLVYGTFCGSMGDYAPLAYLFAFTTVPVCLALAWLMDRLPLGWLRTALRFVGEHSLEIYLLNVSFFSETEFLRRFFDPGPGHYIYYAALYALNILSGWALHEALSFAGKKLREKRG